MSANSAFGNITKRAVVLPFSLEQLFGPRRPGHVVTTPKTPAWLTERAEFVKEWAAMQEVGLKHGFIEHGLCYECGGEVEPTTDIEDREWVYDDDVAPPPGD